MSIAPRIFKQENMVITQQLSVLLALEFSPHVKFQDLGQAVGDVAEIVHLSLLVAVL